MGHINRSGPSRYSFWRIGRRGRKSGAGRQTVRYGSSPNGDGAAGSPSTAYSLTARSAKYRVADVRAKIGAVSVAAIQFTTAVPASLSPDATTAATMLTARSMSAAMTIVPNTGQP